MKARPRHAENTVASLLSDFYKEIDMKPVERIPVIGRTGPDITLNEFQLVVDVKSRKAIPPKYVAFKKQYAYDFHYMIIPLHNLAEIRRKGFAPYSMAQVIAMNSKMIDGYWTHMDEWTQAHCPDGITAVVLHRPNLPYGNACLVISEQDRRRFLCRMMSEEPK
jgi:hypothetical protein